MGESRLFKFFVATALCLFAAFSSFYDETNRIQHAKKEILISGEHHNTLNKSITSSVRIVSSFPLDDTQENNIVTSSSGTYFYHKGISYVITAGHSLIGDCESTKIIADDYAYNCINLIAIDPFKDIGIIEVEKIFNRNPVVIEDLASTDAQIYENTGVHQKIIYTGYPQGMGPLTFDGKIVSHSINNDIYIVHSYAWSGSSGSGVFNTNGILIGIVTAVSVANSDYGIDVMEDLIIVTSIELIDLQSVL